MPVVHTPLRELRLASGLSLRGLAECTGLSKAIISQIERGRMVATSRELVALEVGLGLPIGALAIKTMVVREEVRA